MTTAGPAATDPTTAGPTTAGPTTSGPTTAGPTVSGAATYCDRCGGDLATGAHAACRSARALEPPRFCAVCRRRMKVQVLPSGWLARCVEHGELRG